MKIDYNAKGEYFLVKADTTEEYYTMKLIYDTQCAINTKQTIQELIKKMFKYTIDGEEVSYEEFYKTYIDAKLSLNSLYGKLAMPTRKFITVHKHNNPSIKATIFIDAIQSIAQREDGCASIKTSTCNYDTCDKYDKIIRQLS